MMSIEILLANYLWHRCQFFKKFLAFYKVVTWMIMLVQQSALRIALSGI